MNNSDHFGPHCEWVHPTILNLAKRITWPRCSQKQKTTKNEGAALPVRLWMMFGVVHHLIKLTGSGRNPLSSSPSLNLTLSLSP